MESYETYSIDEIQVGLHRSRSLKESASEHEVGDNILLITSDNPTSKPVPQQNERKNLGKKKRNPVKRVGSMASEVMAKVALTTDFSNTHGRFIQSTLGKHKFNLDTDQKPYSIMSTSLMVIRADENVLDKVYTVTINDKSYSVTGTGGTLAALIVLFHAEYVLDPITGVTGVVDTLSSEFYVFTGYETNVDSFESETEGLVFGYDVQVDLGAANASRLFDSANNEKVGQPVVFINADNEPIQVAFLFKTTGTASHCFLRLADRIFEECFNDASLYIMPLVGVSLDDRPDSMLDILFQRTCDIEDDVAFGSKNEKIVNLLGTTSFTTEHGQEVELENTWTGGDISLIKPNTGGVATDEWRQSLADGTFRDPVQLFPISAKLVDPYVYTIVGDATTDGVINLKCSVTDKTTDQEKVYKIPVNVTTADTATEIGDAIVTAMSAIDDITVLNTAGVLTVNCGAMTIFHMSIDMGLVGTTVITFTATQGSLHTITVAGVAQSNIHLYLNGIEFYVSSAAPATDSAEALAALIAKDSRFHATGSGATLLVYLVDQYDTLTVDSYVEDDGTADAVLTDVETNPSLAVEAVDTPSFFYLTRIRAGVVGKSMEGFCDTDAVTLDFSRTVQVIKSVCTKQGNKGIFNANYTVYLELNAKDTDADKIHDFYNRYKDNGDFGVVGYNSDLGLSFFFPTCTIEEWSGDENSDEQVATKYKLNVNFDPRVDPCLVLPQMI